MPDKTGVEHGMIEELELFNYDSESEKGWVGPVGSASGIHLRNNAFSDCVQDQLRDAVQV
jgi:hypothetical protein